MQTSYPIAWVENDPQRQGAAATYAKRYALLMVAGIAGDPDDDGHAEAKRLEKDRATKERQDKHHESWKDHAKYFMVCLKERGWTYEKLKARLQESNQSPPSNWPQSRRVALLAALDDKSWPKGV
mgnify:CR=1 FL=1